MTLYRNVKHGFTSVVAILAAACSTLIACSQPAEESTSQAATSVVAPDSAALAAEVRATVETFLDAMTRSDTLALDSMTHSNAKFVQPGGAMMSGDERVAQHKGGGVKVTKASNEIVEVQTFGDDFAFVLVRSTSEGETNGRKWVPATVIMALARQPDQHWQIVYHHPIRQEATPPSP